MGITFNALPQELQLRFNQAKADGIVTHEEWNTFSKEEQILFREVQAHDMQPVGDTFTKKAPEAKQERAELSWGEIGKQGLKSVGNFFKGMFCDEEGFSLTKTATTIGMGVVLATLGPAAITVGAVIGGFMVVNGGKNLIKGTKEYYNAKTHEEAVAAMEKAMDGGVEAGMGIAALFGVRKGYTSTKSAKVKTQTSKAQPNTPPAEMTPQQALEVVSTKVKQRAKLAKVKTQASKAQPNTPPAEMTPQQALEVVSTMAKKRAKLAKEEVQARANTTQMRQDKQGSLIEETFNEHGRVTRKYKLSEDGSSYESFRPNGYAETKTVYTKADGTTITREVITDRTTGNTKTITTTVQNGKTSIVETTHLENGLTKSVYKGVEGRLNKVEYHDRYGNLVKTTFEDPKFIGFEISVA